MFQESVEKGGMAAAQKWGLWQENPLGYWLAAAMAGAFISIGAVFASTVGTLLKGNPSAKILMGIVFTCALSLVFTAGGELFTGNNLVLGLGFFTKKLTLGQMFKLNGISYVGNFAGGILFSLMFWGSGLLQGDLQEFLQKVASAKVSLPWGQLLIRGILCNILVCLAVWCTFRLQSEFGKLCMALWCVWMFFTCGFEHSVANMSYLTLGLLGQAPITALDCLHNLVWVTFGNFIGGCIFVGAAYYLMGRKTVQ